MTHHLSEPNLSANLDLDAVSAAEHITQRNKRKRGDVDSQALLDTFKDEILVLCNSIREEQQRNFTSLRSTMEDIKTQNTKLQEFAEFSSAKYDEVLAEMKKMDAERTENRKYIQNLEERVEFLERQNRSTSVEIRNIPQQSRESKQDLANLVIKVGKAINVPIQYSDIKDVLRTNPKKSTIKPIIAEFTTVLAKEALLKSVKNYNKEHKNDKLNTENMNISGPKEPVYIAENLTFKARKLFYLAREFQTTHKYDFCWTSNGKVYLRKAHESPLVRVDSESDITKLKEQN